MSVDPASRPASSHLPSRLVEVQERPVVAVSRWSEGLFPSLIGLAFWMGGLEVITRWSPTSLQPPWSDSATSWPEWLSMVALVPVGWALLAGLLFFRGPVQLAHRTRMPLEILASGPFGVGGARLVVGAGLGLGLLILFTLSVHESIRLTLLCVDRCLEIPILPESSTIDWYPAQGWPYVAAAVIWTPVLALAGGFLVRLLIPLVHAFALAPLAILVLTAMAMVAGWVEPIGAILDVQVGPEQSVWVLGSTLLSLASLASVLAVDWGRSMNQGRGVDLAGSLGLVGGLSLASGGAWVISLLALDLLDAGESIPLSQVLTRLPVGIAAPGLTVLALLSGGLATFSAYSLSQKLKFGLGGKRIVWIVMAIVAGWLGLLSGWIDRLITPMLWMVGAIVAPIASVFTIEAVLSRKRPVRVRRSFNGAGLVAWTVGLAIGLIDPLATILGGANRIPSGYRLADWINGLSWVPSILVGAVGSALLYLGMVALGWQTQVLGTSVDRTNGT